MPKRLLDSSLLIAHLRRLPKPSEKGAEDYGAWADKLISNKGTNSIVSPVEIEVLAGARDPHELRLTEAFLSKFQLIDRGVIPPRDWEEARRIAKHVVKYDRAVPRRDRKRDREKNPRTESRQLGDCLINAIATRLNYAVLTDDRGLLRQAGRTSHRD